MRSERQAAQPEGRAAPAVQVRDREAADEAGPGELASRSLRPGRGPAAAAGLEGSLGAMILLLGVSQASHATHRGPQDPLSPADTCPFFPAWWPWWIPSALDAVSLMLIGEAEDVTDRSRVLGSAFLLCIVLVLRA
eukprot:XP_028353444.1 uncharacterized protein LOC114487477 isoform X2 [Physeter catodon]